MKVVRFLDSEGNERFGCDFDGESAIELKGDKAWTARRGDARIAVKKLLAPIVPTTILGIGLNYRRHAEEGTGSGPVKLPEYPVLFVKGPNTLQNPGDPIEIPTHLASTEVDYECELAVVIGRECKNVSKEEALDYVFGYTCANDVSARDWQIARGGSQWCRGKFFDTFAPMGPCIVTTDEIPDPNTLRIRTILNGDVVQDWNTDDMIFNVPTLVSFLSGSTTLYPGTVLLTGTPHGVGMAARPPRWLKPGDTVTIEIEKIGELTNPVELENG
ncbi:MAG: fumarylacetoacetate hydrolase family protein [Bacteroidetes bacterium]|nr:fumarylacetoacetate hydrolase family protein [Bacteroidota bacterium]